jgi:hypothetical protein
MGKSQAVATKSKNHKASLSLKAGEPKHKLIQAVRWHKRVKTMEKKDAA